MKDDKKVQTPPKRDIEPGHPDYKPGNTATPKQEVYDEDAKAEQVHEKTQPKQDTDDESRKIVNEEEQDQVVNDDEAATQTKPKMNDKPKQGV